MIKKILVLVAFSACLVSARAADLHVAPTGNDANPGTAEEPFATLEKARDAARTRPGSSVLLHGGTYFVDKTLELTPADSGLAIKAFGKETPVLCGGRLITGWKLADAATPSLAECARGKVFVADVPPGWRFHYLSVDGRPAQRARWLNTDKWRSWAKDHKQGAPEKQGQLVTFSKNKDILAGLPSNGDVEMVCIMKQYGVMGNGVLTDIDPAAGTARWNSVQLNICNSRNGGERGYNIENHLKFIDEPGEWTVDSAAGKVYYWPRQGEDLATTKVIAPKLYEIIRVRGNEDKSEWVKNVTVSGLSLIGTDRVPETDWPHDWAKRSWENPDAMVYVRGAEAIVIENCRLIHSGAYGITLKNHVRQSRIEGCEIGWSGSGGVLLEGYGPGTLDVNRENSIVRNWIHDMGKGNYWHSGCISIYQSGHNRIADNLLQRAAYCAISLVGVHAKYMSDARIMFPGYSEGQVERWNAFNASIEDYPKEIADGIKAGTYRFNRENAKPYLHSNGNIIEHNIVVEPEQLLDEGGAIYAWSTGKGNVWRDNIVYKSSGFPGSSILALDDVAEYFTVTGNVVWVNGRATCGTIGMRPSERGNVIHDNIRAAYRKEHGLGCSQKWCATDATRDPVYKLETTIQNEVNAAGGWLGNPDTGIPRPGEEIKDAKQRTLPKGSHVTIE